MGVCLSVLTRLFHRVFHRKVNVLPASSVVVTQEYPHPSQFPTSPTHSNHTGLTEPTCPGRLYPQAPPSQENNIGSETVTIHDSPTQTEDSGLSPPHSASGLPTSPLPQAPLFALIIGIDDYASCRKLRGAVADAKAVKHYLEDVLLVPEDCIRIFLDCQATRDAIIGAFKDLRHNQHIRNGDPILIFYAGHGGELTAPHAWGPDIKIQCLLPYDYRATVIDPIPDRTIGALIEDIAKVKGDNISVIFDCCHSASGTRPHDEEYVPRTVDLSHSVPPSLDKDIWGGRAGAIPNGFVYHGFRSHVLMAACREKELAYEHEGRGQFTAALLTTLKDCAVNSLTYVNVIERICLPKQNPQCEGVNRDRILFDGRVSAGKQVQRTVRINDGGEYVIGAGSAHGVSNGVEFTLCDELGSRLDVVVIDDTATVEDFQTTIMISEAHLRGASFAKLTGVGKMPLYLAHAGDSSHMLKDVLLQMVCNRTNGTGFRLVDEAREAKLELTMDNNLVVFRILDQQVKRFGMARLPHTATLDTIAHVLGAAAHFYWYLDLTNRNTFVDIKQEVTVNFYLLKKDYDEYGLPLYLPVAPGLCRKESKDNSDVIDFVVEPGAVYGIEIKNNTQKDLYLNAFLFNNGSLSIVPYYTQPSTGNPEAPLKQNGTFTIGYGPEGTSPFAYWLDDGQDVDVGHLKIFLATRPIDMSDVAQKSPFFNANARHRAGDDVRKARLTISPSSVRPNSEVFDTWFTINIPIIQRRREKPGMA